MTRHKYTTLQDLQDDCEMEPNTGCWLWVHEENGQGYGRIWHPAIKKNVYVHRLAFQLAGGVIPDGYQIDHLCRQPLCCNPTHLRAVTPLENLQAPGSLASAAKTHCPQGHPYAGDNLYVSPKGYRDCRECKVRHKREWDAANRAKATRYRREWSMQNREKNNAAQRASYWRNHDKNLARCKAYYARTKDVKP